MFYRSVTHTERNHAWPFDPFFLADSLTVSIEGWLKPDRMETSQGNVLAIRMACWRRNSASRELIDQPVNS